MSQTNGKASGTHTAMKSGMLAAEAMYAHFPLPALKNCDNSCSYDAVVAESPSSPIEVTAYAPFTPNINTAFPTISYTKIKQITSNQIKSNQIK